MIYLPTLLPKPLAPFLKCRLPAAIFFIALIMVLANCACNSPTKKSNAASVHFAQLVDEARVQPVLNDKIKKHVDSAFDALDFPTIEDRCKRYGFYSLYFLSERSLAKSINYADSTITLIKENKLETKLAAPYANALLHKGDVLLVEQNYNSAFVYYHEAIKQIRSTNDTCLYAEFNSRLANLSFSQENYSRSATYSKAAFENKLHCADRTLRYYQFQQAVLDNTGLYYDKYGRPDSALYYFRKTLDFIASYEHRFPKEKHVIEVSKAIVYGNMGDVLSKIGKNSEAETFFKNSIMINSKKGYANDDAKLNKIKLGHLYLKTLRLKEAKKILQEVTSIDPNFTTRLYRLQADYYAAVNNHKLSNKYLNAYITLDDSIKLAKKKLVRADFNRTFKSIEQVHALGTLQQSQQNRTLYLVIAAGLLVLSTVIALLIWYNRKKLARINAKIQTQNRDMQTALEALQQSQEENIRIMDIVAHDLRTPLSITISIIDIMLDKEDFTPSNMEMLAMMRTANQNSLEMIVDLLNINTPKQGLKKEPVEMHILLRQCIDLLNIKVSSKNQHITLDAQQTILEVNRDKIWRVISNLIMNASKFSPIGAAIKVQLYKERNSIFISVQDHGIGIPEELKNRIFNIFTDAKRLGTSGEISFGLGLSICKQIVEAHNGKISFTSEINKGTTFLIELPS